MKKYFILFFVILSASQLCAQSYAELSRKAYNLFADEEYTKSVDVYTQAFKLDRQKKSALYFAACAASMSNQIDTAFSFLSSSFTAGWTDIKTLKETDKLSKLRNDPRWKKFISDAQKNIDAQSASYNLPLKKELEDAYDSDQNSRVIFIGLMKKYNNDTLNTSIDSIKKVMARSDAINLKKVKKILDQNGWVGKDEVGEMGNLALTLIIQHADLTTQKKYLPLMQNAQKNGKTQSSFVAALEDRIAIREGRKQIYGSQLELDETTKKYYVLPLIDPENLEKRRSAIGLPPMDDYLKPWGLHWSVESYYKNISLIKK